MVDGSNWLEKTVWMWIIAAAFATAGIMIANNIWDLKENPIAVSIDTISVKVILVVTEDH